MLIEILQDVYPELRLLDYMLVLFFFSFFFLFFMLGVAFILFSLDAAFPQTAYKQSNFSSYSSLPVNFFFFDKLPFEHYEAISHCAFSYGKWKILENLFLHLLAMFLLKKQLFKSFAHVYIGYSFQLLSYWSSLYTVEINPLLDTWLAKIFSYSIGGIH